MLVYKKFLIDVSHRFFQADKPFLIVPDSTEAEDVLWCHHLRLYVKTIPQGSCHLRSGHFSAGTCDNNFRRVICFNSFQHPQISRQAVKAGQHSGVCFEKFRSLLLKQPDALVHGSHQHIAWGTCLINIQQSPDFVPVNTVSIYMKKGRLCQARQSFMERMDHQVCSEVDRTVRKQRMHAKMGSMCFVHNQHSMVPMRRTRDRPNIADHTIVCRRCNKYRMEIRIFLQLSFHILRTDPAAGTGRFKRRFPWNKILRFQMIQVHRMVGRPVAVSCHKNTVTETGSCADRGKNAAGAAVHQKTGLLRSIQCGGILLGFQQNAAGMVEIVKSINFRDIN